MLRFFNLPQQRGMPPGSAVYTGVNIDVPTRIRVMQYTDEQYVEREPEDCSFLGDTPIEQGVQWINVDGLSDSSTVEAIGAHLNLHALVVEDILHTSQRPKVEELDQGVFVVVRMLFVEHESLDIHSEQISFILSGHTLVTFQEKPGDVFDPVRERIRNHAGRVRQKGADYLLYALLDAIMDHYFYVMEHMGERIEAVERTLMEDPQPDMLNEIYALKREVLLHRKSIWPLRDAISQLLRNENEVFEEKTMLYLRDLYDHTIQVIDVVETFRDITSSVQDLFLSSLGNKTNQVMKVLTIIATLFIPLTFIAGIYGMNFDHMPELHWRYGYATVWLIMGVVGLVMMLYFRRAKWF